MKILVVEDEELLSKYLAKALRIRGNIVDVCNDGLSGYEQAKEKRYDVIILDIVMPKMTGLEVCTRLRSEGDNTPIIMLSSKDAHTDKVSGLQSGADDYLAKPFYIDELMARLQALKRRVGKAPKATLKHGNLIIDVGSRSVVVSSDTIELRPKEFDVLAYLVMNKGRIVSREELLETVWSGTKISSSSNRVDVVIKNLRNKIDLPYGVETIHTKHKVGYFVSEKN